MLQFILGRAGFGKTFEIQKIIKNTLLNNEKKILLIVPEQGSFDTEKNILNLLGAKSAAKVQVLTFSRLSDIVFRKVGGNFGKRINNSERNLLMSLAIDKVSDKLKIYAEQSSKMEFINMITLALSEFKMCRVTNNDLLKISDSTGDPVLKKKILETYNIFSAYEELLKNNYSDPLDDLTNLASKLYQHNFFNGYTVILDGFEGFTVQQLSIIEIILIQCKMCYVTLCTDKVIDSNNNDEIDLFWPINRTLKKILNIAKKNSIKLKNPICLKDPKRFKSEGLKFLESQIFRIKKEKMLKDIEDVLVFNARTKYDEADFVCRKIKKLIYEKDYKYSDFAVVTRNDEVYRGILDVTFEKYNIPYFMDKREEIISKPVMAILIYAFEIINYNFFSNSIIKYLKTGLVGVDVDEISELENYVLFWNITGKRWFKDFTSNPDGYAQMDEKSKLKLIKLNELRKKIIDPLLNLKKNVEGQAGDIICKNTYNFLCEINVIENLKNFCKKLNDENQQVLADEQVRLWNILVEIFENMARILKGKKFSSKKYAELLKLTISSYDIAFIPRKVDEVVFGSIDRIRVQDKKIVFLIGAVEGEFPRTPVSSGIFTDAQRIQLILKGLPLYDSLEGLLINERFLAYKSVTLPSEKLFITWSRATTLGGAKSASEIVREVLTALPKVTVIDDFFEDLDDKIWAVNPAFEICARHWNEKSRFSYTLKELFFRLSNYKDKIDIIEKINSERLFEIENKAKIKDVFGQNIKISASQIEKFYMCEFAYFCKYVILAKERKKAKFGAIEYGDLAHFVFEKILQKFSVSELLKFSENDLIKETKKILKYYIDVHFGGWTDKTPRFIYLFSRTLNTLVPLINHMAKELSQSKFLPKYFELKISNRGYINPIKLELFNGTTIEVGGQIDRVDIMEQDKLKYVRIIDYKTGDKDFDLSDVFYGLNLQMLVYLKAFCKNFIKSNIKTIPAGVLYVPLTSTVLNLNRNETLEKLRKEKIKKLQMSGLVLDNKEVIFGMEHDANGVYIPVEIKDGDSRGENSLVNFMQMDSIMKYIDKLIINMGLKLQKGIISANPAKGKYDACEFCEYKSACATFKNENIKKIEHLDKSEFFENIKQKKVEE